MRFLFILFFLFSCTNKTIDFGQVGKLPSISSLFNKRMLLLLKGTYATDSPLDFSDYNNGKGKLYLDQNGDEGGDPKFDLRKLPKADDLDIYVDFGGIRISSKYLKGTGDLIQIRNQLDSKDFWDQIALNRQVYCTRLYDIKKNGCSDSGGLLKIKQFFNGDGAAYPSMDPTSGTDTNNALKLNLPSQYYYTGVYIRSLFFSWAVEGGSQIVDQRFDNRIVKGLDVVPRNNQFPDSSATEKSYSHPKMFPLLYSVKTGQEDMQIRAGIEPYILEVRMNLKENLMVHSFIKQQEITQKLITQTLIGISDWNKNHKGEKDMGGNLLLRSRIIYPVFASELKISGGTKSLIHYYALYRQGEKEKDMKTQLPYAATPVQAGTSKIKYVHHGDYKLQCRKDEKRDGYPEKVIREIEFHVPRYFHRKTVEINLTCP